MIAANRLQWLNGQMADGRDYLCGKRFTLADILLYGWLDFAGQVGQPLIRPMPTSWRGWRGWRSGLQRRRKLSHTSLRAQPSNPSYYKPRHGLLRCARNDVDRVAP
jgi:glutathione S-transferase